MRVTVLVRAFSRVPTGASAGSTSTFFDIQPRGLVMDNSTGEHERHAATMNCSSQKSPRRSPEAAGFSQSRRAAVLGGFATLSTKVMRFSGLSVIVFFRCSHWSSSNHSSIRKPISRTRSRSRRSSAKIFNASLASSPGGRGMALSIWAAYHSHVERQLDGPI